VTKTNYLFSPIKQIGYEKEKGEKKEAKLPRKCGPISGTRGGGEETTGGFVRRRSEQGKKGREKKEKMAARPASIVRTTGKRGGKGRTTAITSPPSSISHWNVLRMKEGKGGKGKEKAPKGIYFNASKGQIEEKVEIHQRLQERGEGRPFIRRGKERSCPLFAIGKKKEVLLPP